MAHFSLRSTAHLTTASVALCTALFLAPAAHAQSASLLAEREAVFQQLFTSPNDRDLMREYARLSVRARDYEAAVSTLERLLDLEPNNTDARFELAQAYFALGAYDTAEYHLEVIAETAALSDAEARQVAAYQDAAEARNSPNQLRGRISAGAAWSERSSETAAIGTVQLSWRVDMGGANASDWYTQFAATAFAPGGTGDRQLLRIRTGPEFRLTGESFGPRLQPYLQFTALRDEDGTDLNEIGVGLAYQNPHSAQFTSFADFYFGQAENITTNVDVDIIDVGIGATYRPTEAVRARLSLNHRTEDGPTVDREMQQARLSLTYEFGSPIAGVANDWELGAQLSAAQVEVTGGTEARQDDIFRIGLSLRAYVTNDAYLEARVRRNDRSSSLARYNTDDTTVSLQLGWEF